MRQISGGVLKQLQTISIYRTLDDRWICDRATPAQCWQPQEVLDQFDQRPIPSQVRHFITTSHIPWPEITQLPVLVPAMFFPASQLPILATSTTCTSFCWGAVFLQIQSLFKGWGIDARDRRLETLGFHSLFSEEPLPTPFPYCLDRIYDTKTMLSWTSNISPFRIRNSSAGCVPSAATFTVAVWRHCVTSCNLSLATEHSDALIHLIQGHESHRSGLSYGVMSTIPLSTTNKDINLLNSFSTFLRCFVQIKGWARQCSVI